MTSPLRAEPQYLLRIPKPSGWHVWAAIFTAGFFLILTVQAYIASVVSGILAIYCILRWCWFMDRPNDRKMVDIGGGIRVPTYATGSASHGWWAMVITLIVAGMVCTLAGFAYIFLWSRRPDLWISPPDMVSMVGILFLLALAATLAWAATRAVRRDSARSRSVAAVTMALAALVLVIGAVWDFSAWQAIGLTPQASSQGATVFALMSWQAVFAGICALMGFYALMRWLFGMVSADRPSTFDLIALFIVFSAAQGTFVLLLTRLFPGA